MKKNGRRWLCFLLVFMLVLGTVPVGFARAEEGADSANQGEGALQNMMPVCGKEEHVHTEECYELRLAEGQDAEPVLVCEKIESEGHVHEGSCYQTVQKQTCGQEESEGHSHDDSCYGVQSELSCDRTEHSHDDGCYDENGDLACETKEHSHDDSCYTEKTVLTCGKDESAGHTHEDGCYEETRELICTLSEEAHHHTDECYAAETESAEQVLVCEKEVHQHTQDCYQTVAPAAGAETAEGAETVEAAPAVSEPEAPEVIYYCGHEADAHAEECFDENGNAVCGNELHTHTHTEECLTEPATPLPEEPTVSGVKYYCGHEADAHTEECFDESGVLICTNEAHTHIHTEECLTEPVQEPEEAEEGSWQIRPEGSLTTAKVAENSYTVTVRSAVNVKFCNEEGEEIEPGEEQSAQKPQGSAAFLIGLTGSEPEGLTGGGLAIKASDGENEIDLTLNLVEEGGQKYLAYEQPYDTDYSFILTMAEEEPETGYTLGIQLYVRNSDSGAEGGEKLSRLAETSMSFSAAVKEPEAIEGEWKVEPEGTLISEKTGENEYLVTADVKTNVRFMTTGGEEIELTEEQLEKYPRPEGRMNFLISVEKDGAEMLNKVLNGNASVKAAVVENGTEREAELSLYETGGKRYLIYSLEFGSEGSFQLPVIETEEVEKDYTLQLLLYGYAEPVTMRRARAALADTETQNSGEPQLLANTSVDMQSNVDDSQNKNTATVSITNPEKPVGQNNIVTITSTVTNNASDAGDYEKTRFWVEFSEIDGLITFKNTDGSFKDQIEITNRDADGNQKTITLHLDEETKRIYYNLEPGDTLNFNLEFNYDNGVSGEKNIVKVEVKEQSYSEGELPSIENAQTANNGGDEPKEAKGEMTWTGDFGWEDVEKSNSKGSLGIDSNNKLKGDIDYTITAKSLNRDTVGEIWTEKLTVTDELKLPEGVMLPSDAVVSSDRTKIVSSGDNSIVYYEFTDLGGYTVQSLESGDSSTIRFTAVKENAEPIKAEMDDLVLKLKLYASKLELAKDYTPGENKDRIINGVSIVANAYNSSMTAVSSDSVETIIQTKGVELHTQKSIVGEENKKYTAGESVPYKIEVWNTGAVDADGVTVKDSLPKELKLTEKQLEQILGSGYVTVEDGNNIVYQKKEGEKVVIQITQSGSEEDAQYTVEWFDQTIPCSNGPVKKEYQFEATLKDAEWIQKNWNNNWIENIAEADGERGTVSFEYDKPNVVVEKEHTEIGDEGDQTFHNEDVLTFTVKVKNESESVDLKNVVVTDILPKGLLLLDEDGKEITQSGTYSLGKVEEEVLNAEVTVNADGTRKIGWTLPVLEKGTEKQITYETKVKVESAGTAAELTNRAYTDHGGEDSDTVTVTKDGVIPDKKIVTEDGTEVEQSTLKEGITVKYVLKLKNTSEKNIVVKNVTEQLPNNYGSFGWEFGKNVMVSATTSEDDHEWAEFGAVGDLTGGNSWWGQAQIVWTEVSVPAGKEVKQTIILTFPSGETWEKYYGTVGGNSGQEVKNEFYFEDSEKVSAGHDLDDEVSAEVHMQKGVFRLGTQGQWQQGSYNQGNSRYYYQSGGSTYVTYYFWVCNTGDRAITIPYAVDKLPEDISYVNMTNSAWNIDIGAANTQITTVANGAPAYGSYSEKGLVSTKGGVNVTAETDGQNLKFIFNDGSGVTLQTMEALSFAYTCKVGEKANPYGSTNYIALAVDDPNVSVSGGASVTHQDGSTELKNDGSCVKLENGFEYADNDQDAIGYGWLESSVTIEPTSIRPGLVKEATAQQIQLAGGGYGNEEDLATGQNEVTTSSRIRWDITLSNDEGVKAIQDYTLTDIIEKPYEIEEAVFTVKGQWNETKYYSQKDDFTFEKVASDDKTNKYRFIFQGEEYAIEPGTKAVLTVYSVMTGNNRPLGTYLNQALWQLSQPYEATDITRGDYVPKTADDGPYIQDSAMVAVMGTFATTSYKKIEEVGASDNWGVGVGSSSEKGNYIEVSDRDKQVRYELHITNTTQTPLMKFNIIDSLPELDDRGTWDYELNARGSQFTVSLAKDPQFAVVWRQYDKNTRSYSDQTLSEGSDYSINYSQETEFDEDDWSGNQGSKWNVSSSDAETARSFRVSLSDSVVLQENDEVVVSFIADIGDDADPGEIAWNAFGYRYYEAINLDDGQYVPNYNSFLTAAPPKVGVKIPGIPSLKKVVQNAEGTDLGVNEEKVFTFFLYEGSHASGPLDGLGYSEVKVQQGGIVSLALKRGHTYTLVEQLSENGLYTLKSIHKQNEAPEENFEGRYVFTYNGEESFVIEAVNEVEEEVKIVLPNTGGPGTLPIVMSELVLAVAAAFIWAQNNAKQSKYTRKGDKKKRVNFH